MRRYFAIFLNAGLVPVTAFFVIDLFIAISAHSMSDHAALKGTRRSGVSPDFEHECTFW